MIRVKLLKNHGATIHHDTPYGLTTAFVPADGELSVAEAAAALGTNKTKIRRLVERKLLRARGGRVTLASIRLALRTPRTMEDGRKTRFLPAAVA